jgi:hypothetical protein
LTKAALEDVVGEELLQPARIPATAVFGVVHLRGDDPQMSQLISISD